MRFRPPVLAALPVLAWTLVAVGCSDAPTRSTAKFCGELQAHVAEIQTPPTDPAAIPALITLFSKMGEVAPLEVQRQWESVYSVLKVAEGVDPADPSSVQAAADAAYAADGAANFVVRWAQQNCAVSIGPIGAVPGGADVETTTASSG
jgi:hypothetical protein